MAQSESKQKLANLIQCYDQVVEAARSLYDDTDLKDWAIGHSNDAQSKRADVVQKLKDKFSIDYASDSAKEDTKSNFFVRWVILIINFAHRTTL